MFHAVSYTTFPKLLSAIALGAGKGKALLIYAEMFGSIAKFPALGIEYYGPLMDVCKENIERLGFRGKIEGYVDDARNLHSYTKSEKILLYLDNPFDWQILGAVLQKLTTGNTVIIYVDPVCSDQLLNLGYSKVKSKTGKYPNQCVTIFQKIV